MFPRYPRNMHKMAKGKTLTEDELWQAFQAREEPKKIAAELMLAGASKEKALAVSLKAAEWLETRNILALRDVSNLVSEYEPPPQTYLQLAAELGMLILAGQDFSINEKRARNHQIALWAIDTALMLKAIMPGATYDQVVELTQSLVKNEFGKPLSSLRSMLNEIPAKHRNKKIDRFANHVAASPDFRSSVFSLKEQAEALRDEPRVKV